MLCFSISAAFGRALTRGTLHPMPALKKYHYQACTGSYACTPESYYQACTLSHACTPEVSLSGLHRVPCMTCHMGVA